MIYPPKLLTIKPAVYYHGQEARWVHPRAIDMAQSHLIAGLSWPIPVGYVGIESTADGTPHEAQIPILIRPWQEWISLSLQCYRDTDAAELTAALLDDAGDPWSTADYALTVDHLPTQWGWVTSGGLGFVSPDPAQAAAIQIPPVNAWTRAYLLITATDAFVAHCRAASAVSASPVT